MIDELRHFVLIAEQGTFTRAARRAHLSQPALTASIQRLERDLGATLLERGRAGATTTAAGAALLPRARAALAAIEDARRAVMEVAGLHSGEVRIGAGATVCTYLLPPILTEFRGRHPGVHFLLREATTPEVQHSLEAGELDLGVVTAPEGEPWYEDELVLVAAPAFARRAPIDPARAPFVTFGRGATTRELLDRHFPEAEVVMELGGIAAIKANVRAGMGIALVSRAAVITDLAQGRLVEVPHPATPVPRLLSLVHRGADRLPPAAAALRKLLLEKRPAPPPAPRRKRR